MKNASFAVLIILFAVLTACNNKKSGDENVDSNQEKTISDESTTAVDSSTAFDSKVPSKGAKTLADVYKQLQKPAQIFSVPASKDTTLICKEGTRLKIKANSFINEKTKQAVTGNVMVSVTEYYKMSDIVLAKLSTTTNGRMLETGGMLNIDVRSKTFNCILKKGSTIGIEFAKQAKKEGMELYTGIWKNESINWTLDKSAVNLNKPFATANLDQLPMYPGGNQKMYDFIGRSFNPNQRKNGKMIISFVIDKTGSVTDPKVIKSINKAMDKEALRIMKRLLKFSPGKIDGEPVNVYYTLPITIEGGDDEDDSEYNSKTVNLEEKYTKNTIQNATLDEVSTYIFSTANLGWINCDRLWDTESARVNYVLNTATPSQTSVSIIFHKYGASINRFFDGANYTFQNVPINEKVTIVAIKCVDGKTQLAVKETQIGNKPLNDLVFKPISFDMLKEELKRIDKI